MTQSWYKPATRRMERVAPPANDARAESLLAGREKAVEIFYYLRGPAYRMGVQLAFQSTWEHFRD